MMRYLLLTLSLLLLLVSPARAEEIGKVIAARGDTYAVSPEGEQRELKRRSVILGGDTLFTGAGARLQIRFADGTLVALRPESEYRIDSYQFNEAEGDENFSTLLKGGFRTITGVISKQNPEAYQVETPVATIGVRGTNYETALTANGLDVAAWQGGVKVRTKAGELDIGAGQDFNFATVGGSDTKPQGLLKPPPSMSGPLAESIESSASAAETESETVVETDGEDGSVTEESQDVTAAEDDAVAEASQTEQATTDSGFDSGADDGGLSGSETDVELSDGGFTTDIGFDDGVTSIITEDPTLTVVEPPSDIIDFIDTIAANDKRLDPLEWEKLFTDGYGGFMVFGGQNSDHIIGGRALAPTATTDPVFTEKLDLEPFDPAFKTAGVDYVYRRGMAPLDAAGVVAVGTENVYWGIWNGSTTPADKLINPNDPNQVEPIDSVVFWAVARPIDPLRTDVAVFDFVDTFHGGGSLGLLSPGDVTQFSMQINFATGAITNGVFDLNKGPDNWNVLFNGTIQGPFVHLNIKPASQINSLYPIIGDIGGFMTGKGGKALVGGFDLQQDGNPSNHIEGIFILRE